MIKLKSCIIFFLAMNLTVGLVQATNINSCQDLAVSDTYVLTSSVSSSGTCFNIQNHNIIIDLSGYTVTYATGSSNSNAINITGYNNSIIKNGSIVSGSSNPSLHAIRTNLSNNATFRDLNTTLITSSYGFYLLSSNNFTVENVTVSSNKSDSYGMFMQGSKNGSINNSRFNTSAGTGSDAFYIYSGSDNIRITNNTINRGSRAFKLESVTNLTASNNTILTSLYPPIYIVNTGTSSYFAHNFTSNTIENLPIYYYYNNNIINHSNDASIGYLFIADSDNAIVSNVTSKYGFASALSLNGTITNSTFDVDGSFVYGLYLYGSSEFNITNTTATSSGNRGCYILSSNNTFTNVSCSSTSLSTGTTHGLEIGAFTNNTFYYLNATRAAASSYDIKMDTGESLFINLTNITKKVFYFVSGTSYFNSSEGGGVYVKVNLSAAGSFDRNVITTWNNSVIDFSDNSTSGSRVFYNISGMKLSKAYYVINQTTGGQPTIQTLTTDSSGYLPLINSTLPTSIYITSGGAITSWSNNITNNDTLSFSTTNFTDAVMFNATPSENMSYWNWSIDGIDKNNNNSVFNTTFSISGERTIRVSATNINGTTNTISWIVTVPVNAPDNNTNLLWARTDGNNTCTGQENLAYSEDTTNCAFATITYAVNQLVAGNTLNIVSGTWINNHSILAASGNSTHPIIIQGYGGIPVIDGNDATATGGIGFSIGNGKHDVHIIGLNITNYFIGIQMDAAGGTINNTVISDNYISNIWKNPIFFTYSSSKYNAHENATIKNNIITNGDLMADFDVAGITTQSVNNSLIKNNTITSIKGCGIGGGSHNIYNSTIEDNYLHDGLSGQGMITFLRTTNTMIRNNTLINGTNRGIRIDAPAGSSPTNIINFNNTIRDNIIKNQTSYSINLYPNISTYVINNTVMDGAGNVWITGLINSTVKNNHWFRHQVSVGGDSKNTTYENNDFINITSFSFGGADNVSSIKNNIFYGTTVSFDADANYSFNYNYYDITPTWGGAINGTYNIVGVNPLFANSSADNYYLQSQYGRWNGVTWVNDATTSSLIDAGDPSSDYSLEPTPNGNRINIGSYGNTIYASKSQSVSPTPTTTISAYVASTCASTLKWGEVGSALIIVLILISAGGLALGFMTGTLKIDTFPLIEFVFVLIAVVVVGSIGIALINPIITAVGCP